MLLRSPFRFRGHRYLEAFHVFSVALDGLKFVVPGWSPGPDDGSLAETNSNCHGQELMESYTRFVPRALS